MIYSPLWPVRMEYDYVSLDPDEFTVVEAGTDPTMFKVQAVPYHTHRDLNCKERWRGKTIGEIFSTEFGLTSKYVDQEADIRLNGNECSSTAVVRNGDVIRHEWMATEPELLIPKAQMPRVIFRTENVVVVFKPHSLPTTPQGLYYKTNLVYIVKRGLGLSFAQPVNRLDRAVAGLVVLVTSPSSVAGIEVVEKKYIAKTIGIFPKNITESRCKLKVEKHIPNQVLRTVIDEQYGVESHTLFHPFRSGTFVECRPITGRTHQIRVHLSGLGFPIVGDSLYSGSSISNLEKQPDMICLFALAYSFRLADSSDIVRVECTESLYPDWLRPS